MEGRQGLSTSSFTFFLNFFLYLAPNIPHFPCFPPIFSLLIPYTLSCKHWSSSMGPNPPKDFFYKYLYFLDDLQCPVFKYCLLQNYSIKGVPGALTSAWSSRQPRSQLYFTIEWVIAVELAPMNSSDCPPPQVQILVNGATIHQLLRSSTSRYSLMPCQHQNPSANSAILASPTHPLIQ